MASLAQKLLGICLLSSIHLSAQAVLIVAEVDQSTEQLGEYEIQADWTGSALELSITNTSSASNGGFLTGFLINLPYQATFTNATTDTGLVPLMPIDGPFSGAPFGNFDYGFAVGGNFLGGGNPSNGIGVGETGHFTLSSWTNLPEIFDRLSNDEIEHYLFDNKTTSRLGDAHFLGRFRGFQDGGSDKVPGMFATSPPPPAISVPNPATLALFTLGAFALLIRRKF